MNQLRDHQPIVLPFKDEFLGEVVRIHQSVLGYTLNSQLGERHLSFMYREMCKNPGNYVGAALIEDRVAGVVSGALNMDITRSALIRLFKVEQWVNIAAHMTTRPSLSYELSLIHI